MSRLRHLRQLAGSLIYDWPGFEKRVSGPSWLEIRNRNEHITTDGRGVRCEWPFTSDLHIAGVLPFAAVRLLRRALDEWPVVLRDAPSQGAAEVTFLIGHRGAGRLPHLLATLRSIAGQSVPVECIVVEQSVMREIEVPTWVRYVHSAVPEGQPYSRAAAFNVASRHATTPILICHDNDMLVPGQYAAEAAARLHEGWQFLDIKRFLFYLSEGDTQRFFATGDLPADAATKVVQNARGGSIVADADAYRAIGGFDAAFVGWGGEDNDFWERALTTDKAYAYGYLPMIHLDHPFQAGKGSGSSEAVARYRMLQSVPPAERIVRLRREQKW